MKNFILILMALSALAMGACGKSDDKKDTNAPGAGNGGIGGGIGGGGRVAPGEGMKLVGACTYGGGGMTVCEQVAMSGAVPAEEFKRSSEIFRQKCEEARGNVQVAGTCATANAAGGCKSKVGAETQGVIILYKQAGFEFPVEQMKAKCEEQGMEFFRP